VTTRIARNPHMDTESVILKGRKNTKAKRISKQVIKKNYTTDRTLTTGNVTAQTSTDAIRNKIWPASSRHSKALHIAPDCFKPSQKQRKRHYKSTQKHKTSEKRIEPNPEGQSTYLAFTEGDERAGTTTLQTKSVRKLASSKRCVRDD
jgi:hypothetical protein